MSCIRTFGLTLCLAIWASPLPATADDPAADSAGIEFFEKKVRPILVEHCHRCHGDVKEPKGNLRLDSRAAVMKGGDRGPALVAGEPDKSFLVQAVRYTDNDLRMPPKGKLADEQIADLAAWVKRGAPMPADSAPTATVTPEKEFNLAERRKHWCYQPLAAVAPPEVKNKAWVKSPIDAFILQKLEAAGLEPAPPAEARTLLRRVYFDLIGLPPTPEEIASYEQSAIRNPHSAFPDLVEKLLASPHYGERWGRHWLDLVRFAETLGHEFDYEIHNAWRYRDYVIRAFNADVPYDQFVIEHLAGDLVAEPRRHPTEGWNESIIGTGWFWFGEGKHSPVDIRQEQLNKIDNQIDVFGKTFLAQTIACARCHDHKFDAIATKDYYALAGLMKSTRYEQAAIDGPDRIDRPANQLRQIKTEIVRRTTSSTEWNRQCELVADYLLAAQRVMQMPGGITPEQAAADAGLVKERVERWVAALNEKEMSSPEHPLFVWKELARGSQDAESFTTRQAVVKSTLRDHQTRVEESRKKYRPFYESQDAIGQEVFESGEAFTNKSDADWRIYEQLPWNAGSIQIGNTPSRPLARWAHGSSTFVSPYLEGAERTCTCNINKRYLHIRAAGRAARVNVVVDGFNLIRDPIYGALSFDVNHDDLAWHTIDMEMWRDHRAYVETVYASVPDLTKNRDTAKDKSGYVTVHWIILSNERSPPPLWRDNLSVNVLVEPSPKSLAELAVRFEQFLLRNYVLPNSAQLESRGPTSGGGSPSHSGFIDWLLVRGLLDFEKPNAAVVDLQDDFRATEARIVRPTYVPAASDGTYEDEPVLLRGNYRTPGDPTPRALPAWLRRSDRDSSIFPQAGERYGMALDWTVDALPQLSRVMVNRIWQHHFGFGIVRTPDDFGRMGQTPTHPELLDYLAAKFIRRGWSIKEMHRLMLNSSAYQMASSPHLTSEILDLKSQITDPKSPIRNPQSVDPENKLLYRQNLQRLEAEIIRDNLLAVSGRLDRKQFGPSVLPHLTPFMEGRGRPGSSGPLDGDGRRSIYINVRRNFLTPMFLAFDYPIPFTTIGRRTSSNVPAQALSLMNGPLVLQESQRWAQAVLAEPNRTPTQRIDRMYQRAFARVPTEEERETALLFVAEQGQRYGAAADDPRAWADLCHVLMNVKEFIFVE